LYNAIKEKLDKLEGYQKKLYEQALASKMYYLKNGGHVTHRVWDNLIFKKTREAFGGRVRLMVSGSAPMSPEVVDFLKCVVCVPFLEGYG
jgi:long-chain acyl-CoA synthetase